MKEPTALTSPTQPTPPTPEVVPNTKSVKPEAEVKWHKNKVVTETDIPTPPTSIVPPTPEVPTEPTLEVPEQPAKLQTLALPNTGTESSTVAVLAGAMAGLLGLGLARKKKED